jgi:CRISPR-associated endonuclease/helicase Cas3
MLPIHAGLTGNDCLYVLDEVHLSQPFAQTLRAIIRDRRATGSPLPDRFDAVSLSATPGEGLTDAFQLTDVDRDPIASPVLARRLGARKPASTRLVGTAKQPAEDALPPTLADLARQLTGTVGVIVNRVETARRVADLLGRDGAEVLLVTGRMRPFDRDVAVEAHRDRLITGRDRGASDGRLFLVGTQCLEVGADFDLDALVTECAPWDALRQRFGRVDRDGLLAASGRPAPITIVKAAATGADDPIYGAALEATWRELRAFGGNFDAGVEPDITLSSAAVVRRPDAPLLLRHHWTTWAQTRPQPQVSPDPDLWLHGPDPSTADVTIVWRHDLTPSVIAGCGDDVALRSQVEAMLRLLPPLSGEALPVPVPAARAWLTASAAVAVTDLEGVQVSPPPGSGGAHRQALRVRGGELAVVGPDRIKPGDTLIVPTSYGGIDNGNWAPAVTASVADIAREVRIAAGRDEVIRLLNIPGNPPSSGPFTSVSDQFDDLGDWAETHLGRRPGRRLVTVIDYSVADPERRFFVLRYPAPPTTRPRLDATAGLDQDGTDERNSFTGHGVGLSEHCAGVGQLASELARRLGLPDSLVTDLALAGRLHDLGKADPRFQRWLTAGGSNGGTLAKSILRDPRDVARARAASGYPAGARHELTSLALADSAPDVLAGASDPELVRHLVASHHGWCRPWAPAVPDPDPVDVSVAYDGTLLKAASDHELGSAGSGVADRFFSLLDRYGWHGLAWLETILRLADHRRSELDDRTAP